MHLVSDTFLIDDLEVLGVNLRIKEGLIFCLDLKSSTLQVAASLRTPKTSQNSKYNWLALYPGKGN